MGYPQQTGTDSSGAASNSRKALVLTLLVAFVLSTFLGSTVDVHVLMASQVSSHDGLRAQAMVQSKAAKHDAGDCDVADEKAMDHSAMDDGAAHHHGAVTDRVQLAAQGQPAHEPCGHCHDCDCSGQLMSHCCAQFVPFAALGSQLRTMAGATAGRNAQHRAAHSESEETNPPTPPPRLLLG
jgi:hypothetical protein